MSTLTISISESLQRFPGASGAWPAASNDWDAATAAAALAQQQSFWAGGAIDDSSALEAYQQLAAAEAVAAAWAGFPAAEEVDSFYSDPHAWPLTGAVPLQASEPGSAFARAVGGDSKPSQQPPAPQSSMASPLRAPLPQPLQWDPEDPMSALENSLEMELLELPDAPEEPRKISPRNPITPPGLSGPLATPPGISVAPAPAPSASWLPKPTSNTAVADHAPPGMSINSAEVAGRPCTKVEWRIDDFSGKLQASSGRPVVSPAFSAAGLSNLRLMVFPDARDIVKSARSHERKNLYSNMVKKGPLYSSLKLKADGLERSTVMTFSLLVGSVRVGPKTYDFSEQAVRGPEDFGVDWLQQVEKVSGSLRVSIEIFEVMPKA